MIQRIQTLWLLVAAALAFTTLKLSFFSGNILVNNVKEFKSFTAMNSIPLMILTVAVGITALITIFLFKDRKLQLKIGLSVLVVSVINIFLNYLNTKNYVENEWKLDITCFLTFAIPAFLFVALRGIYKDEKLVKNADRLR